MEIQYVKAFTDNYIWIIEDENELIVVDPGESQPVFDYLEHTNKNMAGILLTHKHADHVEGVKELKESYPQALVIGPSEVEKYCDRIVEHGDCFELMNHSFQVLSTPGHTANHVSYLKGEALFCGDALFSGGCGRVFTDDYYAQFETLKIFAQLPDEMKVYAGHEYTEVNLDFALTIEPKNRYIKKYLDEVRQKRANNEATLPTTIAQERKVNLFLRAKDLDEFRYLRQERDQFKG